MWATVCCNKSEELKFVNFLCANKVVISYSVFYCVG